MVFRLKKGRDEFSKSKAAQQKKEAFIFSLHANLCLERKERKTRRKQKENGNHDHGRVRRVAIGGGTRGWQKGLNAVCAFAVYV